MNRKALGKGLDALFGAEPDDYALPDKPTGRRIISVSVNDIIPNRNQPRERFSDEAMEDLKKSIAENGILEPPIVRRKGDYYELIAGERRFRAAKELHFETIEVILMDIDSEDKMLVLSLVENIQRENLNAIEEAKACRAIMERMNITQEELAGIVGKSRSTVANTLRLLNLSEEVRAMVEDGLLAPGSARALVPVQDRQLQYKLAQRIAKDSLSARKAEALVRKALQDRESEKQSVELSPYLKAVCDDMRRVFGTEVKMKGSDTKGRIEISYYSQNDLERIMELIRNSDL